jgi:endonuclease/exonuclease/phosphatase (EEP) superfamily protein YafD
MCTGGWSPVKGVLAAAAVFSVTASILALAARTWWFFDLITHFSVQILLFQGLLIAAFAFRRDWRWCGGLAAGGLLNVWVLLPQLVPSAPSPAVGPTLTVLTVNVQARNDQHAGLLGSIEETGPDVLLLVEFTTRWGEHITSLGEQYPHQFRLPTSGSFGIALLSRFPFESARELQLGATTAIDAVLAVPGGNVRLIGVHLIPPVSRAGSDERNAQLATLAALADNRGEPLVITGDFNLSPYSPHYRAWIARTGFVPARPRYGLSFTWPSYFPPLWIPIDHCMVSDELIVAGYRRLAHFGSDHYPILVTLARRQPT